ncbi:TY5A, partial [Symbiodinium microadriaticum]
MVILDIGCMRSVVGVGWATEVIGRWREEGRWHRVEKEVEAFRFGDGEVLYSRYRVEFVGTFAGKEVVFGFSVVDGVCPPLFSRSGCTQLGIIIDCEHRTLSSRKLGVKSFGMGQDEGHYTVRIDEFTTDMSWRELPEDFRLPSRTDAMILMPEVLLETERTVTSSGASAFDGDLGGSGEAAEMQACPQLVEVSEDGFDMVTDQGEELHPKPRKNNRPVPRRSGDGKPPSALAAQAAGSQASVVEISGLTAEEMEMVTKRRAKAAAAKSKAAQHRALTGEKADYPSLSQVWSWDVALNIAASTKSRLVTFGWKRMLWQLRVKAAVEAEGDRRPNRGTTQRLKAGVTAGKAIMAALIATTLDPGNYKVVEVVDGAGSLASCLRGREGWEVAEVIDVAGGWTPDLAKRLKEAYKQIELQQPDLVVLSPRPWMAEPTEDPSLWEARRAQLPLWKWVAEVWKLQQGHGRLVVVVQPAQSQALHLSFMKERDGVIKVPVAMCAFVPAGERRALRNFREVMVEEAFKQLPGGSLLGLGDSVPQDEDWAWETAPEQGSTGERYDYITYDGSAMQQPRRLRQTVAHLHVTLGHLSNERLARMLSLSGGQASVVDLAKKLRCQVCAMVRPPQATPQVAYRKPKQFNERVMGDSFYIWDKAGQKFVVTHYIDGLTDYHIGDLTDRPDSGFAREILQDLWIASFGAPDLLVTDGGRSTCLPGSLMQQICTGEMRYQYNQAMETNEALQRADRIRQGAVEAFFWLDAHSALRKALTSRSRPPTLEGIREGATVYVYDPPEADKPAASDNPPAARRSARRPASSSSSSSETSDTDGGDKARPAVDPQSEEQERRAKLLDDVPMAMKTFADRRKSEEAALADPHALDFAKKRKLFEKLSKALEPPSVLEEGMIREQLTDIYGKFKEVKKALNKQKGPRRARGGGKASARTEAGRHASGVMVVEEEVDASSWFAPGEYEAMLQDTLGHWVLWSSPSVSAGVPELREVSLRLQREEAEAMAEGVTEVKTGKARIEYRWKELDGDWQTAFVPALKKAIGVYLEHHGIRGVAADKVLDPKRLWYLEYKDTIEEIGLKELTLVPGMFRAFHPNGQLRALASIHVDDTRYAGDETSGELWDLLHQRLKFGKMRKATDGWQKFCGRWELQAEDGVVEYIHDVITGVGAESELTPEEKRLIGSVVGQLNWAARQGRYDLGFVASLIQQLAGQGKAEALRWVNAAVRRAREPMEVLVRKFDCDLSELLVVSVSDAAYGAMPNGSSQGGTMVLFADPAVLHGQGAVCIMEAASVKIQRVVRCSMSAEVSSLATAFEHGDFVRAVLAELLDPTFRMDRWKLSASRWRHLLVTDAKTGYDAISSEVLPSDRKIAIDVGVLRQGLLEPETANFI